VAIKAIETRYKGYKFRSRLEARWAVFFDAMGIVWDYEREGYQLPSGYYLPDFWLYPLTGYPDAWGGWVEIKGEWPMNTSRESRLLQELAEHTQTNAIMLIGPHILDRHNDFRKCILAHPLFPDAYQCSLEECLPTITMDEPKFIRAIHAARSARFEHGQSGAC
jgi:hypothetical protein